MACRWIYFLLGVALIQGIFTFSPIPDMQELNDEWVKFNQRLEDNPDFRLPETTKPRNYKVLLTPYFNNPPTGNQPFTFDGSVDIYIHASKADVSEIVLHCNDLIIQSLTVKYTDSNGVDVDITTPDQQFSCDSTTNFLRINTTEALDLEREYVISSFFNGTLQTNMRGFYRSWYRDSTSVNGIRWMATTQFQPGHARQAFPCYDEPGFKATFDISISREDTFSETISNMPIANKTAVENGRITETFFTTPRTSTYLLAFIVSHYDVVSENNDQTRPFQIFARDNIGNHGDWSRDVGERLLTAMEAYTGIPYYEMAPNMNMKQAAIPDFSAGAMENWGLLTYREALILYDPENSNHFYKQRVANIVSHEIAHMWFGNLVTCAWWDNLWLNEGFARFYQYYLTAMVEPSLGFETRFIVEQLQVAMISDSIDTAHALTNPAVSNPVSVSAHFSTITYARGAAVLRMTQHLLGYSTFQKALRNYLDKRKFDVVVPEDLFSAFDAAAADDGVLSAYNGITIDKYFKTWSEKAGHPLLTVGINHQTGRMTITQSRWERTTGSSNNPSLYDIPITWTREKNADFLDLKPTRIMTNEVETIQRGSTGLEWVIFNKQESGFYRVNYDDMNWNLLTRALRADKNVIHEYNRAQIVDDLFAFARANVLPYHRVFNILSYLVFEDDYAPWIAAINGFEFAIRRLAHDNEQRQELNNLIIEHSDAVVKRLGFNESDNEDYMLSLQRMYVMRFLCNVGHEGCVAAAKESFASFKTGGTIKANLRPWVYCAGLRAGDDTDFDAFWAKYLREDLAGEQVVLIEAAGCTSDTASLGKFWEAITAGEDNVLIRAQDVSTALNSAITANEENTMKSFTWLKENLDRVRNTIGLQSPLNTIFSRLLNEQEITEATAWLNENRETLGETIYENSINAIGSSRANMAWYQQRAPEFAIYFETGYVEQNIDPEDGESGSGDGESGSGEGESGSGEGESGSGEGESGSGDGESGSGEGESGSGEGESGSGEGESGSGDGESGSGEGESGSGEGESGSGEGESGSGDGESGSGEGESGSGEGESGSGDGESGSGEGESGSGEGESGSGEGESGSGEGESGSGEGGDGIGSANIATLSVITLIATLSINFLA